MTESRSPRRNPSAASPRAKSRTWSWYSRHVHVCQMPLSFSLMAGRSPRSLALFWSSCGSVRGSATLPSIGRALAVPEVRLDYLRVRPYLVRRAIGDLLSHVEHGHPIRDVHDHTHVVL